MLLQQIFLISNKQKVEGKFGHLEKNVTVAFSKTL